MSGSLLSLPGSTIAVMRVLVLSVTTGELVWDYTSGSFWQARGWELRMWLCEAIRCAQYFSVILLVRQLLLCDMAFIGEYADGDVLLLCFVGKLQTRRTLTCNRLQWPCASVIDLGYGQNCLGGCI